MDVKKMMLFSLIFLLFATNIFAEEKVLINSQILSRELKNSLKDQKLTLTMYYLPWELLTDVPQTEEDILNGFYYYKVVVSSSVLNNHLDFFDKLSQLKIEETKDRYADARIYGEFNNNNQKIFTFSLGGAKMMVNGHKVNVNEKIFYDFAIQFLPNREVANSLKENENQQGNFKLFDNTPEKSRLFIYYLPLNRITSHPLNSRDLTKDYFYEIEVNTDTLDAYMMEDMRHKDNIMLQKLFWPTPVNVRIYCEFKNSKNNTYSFSLGGENEKNMLVNGWVAKKHKFFFDFVQTFLPECEVESYRIVVENIHF